MNEETKKELELIQDRIESLLLIKDIDESAILGCVIDLKYKAWGAGYKEGIDKGSEIVKEVHKL